MDENLPSTSDGEEREISLKGADRIAAYVKTLPDAPGVYRMLNAKNEVLYVGKAASLKKRVASYAKPSNQSYRIMRMISETTEMIFISTASETEALLLESNLIKRLKPRYNVSYRDDKSFPNILLRTCSDAVFQGRTRPCLLHQIKRCSAPCTGRIDAEGYAALVEQAKTFLTGKSRLVQEQLAQEMQQASETMDFETAAQLRDRIRAMSQIHARQGINPTTFTEADVFALHREGGQSCVQVFFFRASQNWGNKPYFPRHAADLSNGEVLGSFLGQFYDTRVAPSLILLNEDVPERALLAEALCIRAGHRVEIAIPSRGEKREIVDAALLNARAQLARNQAESASQRELLEGVAETFGLDAPPKRIEVYDNSHIQGANAVGAMIVAGPEGFQKSEYRKFNIKSAELALGDDMAMMKEVLTRRFGRLVREAGANGEADEKWNKWPDLVLIDGGALQVNAAHAALAEVGIDDEIGRAHV